MMVMNASRQAEENREYVRRLLKQKQPRFAEALEQAVDRVWREMHDCAGALPAVGNLRAVAGNRAGERPRTLVRR